METPIVAEKARIRARVRAVLGAMSPEQLATGSARARALLLEQAVWHKAQTILFYAPLPGELDLWPLAAEALRAGKRIALPRFDAATGGYAPSTVQDLGRDLVIGKLGIREPGPGCAAVESEQIDLVLVPGIAFDAYGRRLGRGKGFYDRLLQVVGGVKCGVAFDEQIVSSLPVEPHDQTLDYILTPTRWIVTRHT